MQNTEELGDSAGCLSHGNALPESAPQPLGMTLCQDWRCKHALSVTKGIEVSLVASIPSASHRHKDQTEPYNSAFKARVSARSCSNPPASSNPLMALKLVGCSGVYRSLAFSCLLSQFNAGVTWTAHPAIVCASSLRGVVREYRMALGSVCNARLSPLSHWHATL